MSVDQDTVVRALLTERVRMLAYIWSIVRDEHLAEDLYQEVSILAINKREEIGDESHLMRWLRHVARGKAIDALRRRNLEAVGLSDRAAELLESAWDRHDDQSDDIESLRQCLNQLTPYAQRIVTMRYVDGLKGTELAERLNRRVRTIYVALSRIHNALSDCIRARQEQELTRG